MRQYCSVCKAHLEMTVVSDTSDDGVIWLKCPRCKGILPHMDDGSGEAEESAPESATSELQEIDISKAVPYEPQRSYEVGDVVHHRGWDDYGVVLSKESLPGNRHAIKVKFTENGELQLIVEA